ncbi:MAG TPA: MMPL family transporter [Mycobacteriales bacterium]|jgi:RND superfamily putative drug exporter|nr:MMPL family transporter [Mycobacteriales bacterium]
MRRLAGWCYDHRWIVVGAWIVALVALTGIEHAAGDHYRDDFKLSGTESADAQNLLEKAAPSASGDVERVVFAAGGDHTVTDPVVRNRIQPMLERIEHLPNVASVLSPYDATGRSQISPTGKVGYATVTLAQQAVKVSDQDAHALVDTAKAASNADVKVAVGGWVAESTNPQSFSGVGIGVGAALLVLFIVFGLNWAAVTPLLTAGISLTSGIAVIGLLSHVITTASFSSQLSELIGLGVGVDYALFIVTRTRQGLRRGLDPRRAVVDALDTSGRAVMFAGVTVAIALLGMFALGISFLYGVAIAATIAVLFTVVAAMTFLPALLGFIGRTLLWSVLKRRRNQGYVDTDESPSWARWARRLQRRPVVFAAAAGVVIIVLALPFFSLRLGSSDQGNDPKSTTTRQAYDMLADGFGPGFNGPLQLIAPLPSAGDKTTLSKTVAAIRTADGVAGVGPTVVAAGKDGNPDIALVNVFPVGSPQDRSTTQLLHRLRDDVIPPTVQGTDLKVYVGGQTAIVEDFSKVLAGKLPLFVGVVVLLSFLLLMAVFRSLLVPLIAAVMNLLSIGAAFGVVVAVFQYGWLSDLIGVSRAGPIEAFVPVLMFAILFGLSMDYEVFLVSRIYEEWHRRKNNSEAISHGLAATGRTITAAAAIMVLVFAAFMLGDNRVIKLLGLGLASAVLMDALIIRSVLVPALMHLFGSANWKLPAALDRILPRLNVEGSAHLGEVDADSEPPSEEPILISAR